MIDRASAFRGRAIAVRGLAAAGLMALAAIPLQLDGASVPTPGVTGPIPATRLGDPARDYPFYASAVDLEARGYVEDEFFIEGTANRYDTPTGATGSIIDGNHPFRTRIVVRRPVAAPRFNGTVLVEWNNVTARRDLDIDWFQMHDHLMRSGYAWVGVTAQRLGVGALKVWNATRYGTLDLTHGGTIQNDALSYDVFAQAAQAVRSPGRVDVMGGLKVQRIFATGHSQSAGRLATYVNAVHPLAPVFDAVIVHGGGGRIRTDLAIPVWKLLAETDVVGNQAALRQPDTRMFRSWEVAGSSHVDLQFVTYSRQLSQRDGSPVAPDAPSGPGRAGAPPSGQAQAPTAGTSTNPGGCQRPPYSHIPFHYVMNAAIDHLVRWVRDGVLPPTAPPLDLASAGSPTVMARDARGNALGGIRLAEHAVPTAANTGENSGPGFCRLNGSHEPFDRATLSSLYPTHDAYMAAVREVTAHNVKAGYILEIDARATLERAERFRP